jgi:ABC-type nitrate/sulfonate/bicarbonate transport system ATPase subunit
MDDPLQHNDVIHAAAFADIMCNLVEVRKHQIFLSTHDIAQAEFLRRKFGSRNIPCTSVHLLGRGRDGLEVQVKGYDSRLEAGIAVANS